MKIFKHSSFPGRIRRSTALISAAILLSTTVYAEVAIGRLPSTSEGGGTVIGAKPNVFLVIDNGESMAKNPQLSERGNTDKGNLLQQTAGALIAALPQLEGKVRLGYTTTFPGVNAFKNINCGAYKVNGNVDKLDKIIPNLKSDLKSNANYLMADGDFIFKDSSGNQLGSGYGEITPRDFRDNYARYIYAWLGAMCPGASNDDIANRPGDGYAISDPPYADLRDGELIYRKAAEDAKNPFSFPLTNKNAISFGDTNSARPLVSMHGMVLAQIADSNFLSTIGDCSKTTVTTAGRKQTGTKCKNLLSAENAIIDPKRKQQGAKRLPTDAYAPVRASDGFPDQDGSKYGCRRNYEIVISAGPYGYPANLNSNTSIGNSGIRNTISNQWTLPSPIVDTASGETYTNFPKDNDYTRIFRHLKPYGQAGVTDLPATTTFAGRQFLYSRTALQSYYNDLRSDLENIVPPFYASKTARNDGPSGAMIPPAWDRKNDPASWQHLTVFSLGFSNKFKSWEKAKIYQKNYSDLNPEDGELEGYLRAIEDGSIYADNAPYWDWARGNYQPKNGYIYRAPDGTKSRISFAIDPGQLGIDDPLAEMDFIKAGISSRGGAYPITDYASIKKVINSIASRIETAMAQGITGGATSSGRVTASSQAAGGNGSVLFTTYIDEATLSGNIFTFKNCPLIQERIQDKDGNTITNPEWVTQKCGTRLWNAATALNNSISNLGKNTITAVKNGAAGALTGEHFAWDNLDAELKTALKDGDDDAMGQARAEWVNGKLKTAFSDEKIKNKLRARPVVVIPEEGQTYKMDKDGNLVKDAEGNYIKAEPTSIPNRIGEIVYASPKAVDNRGTLGAAHPLNNDTYADFVENTVKKRKPLVMAGANDGHLYAFSTSSESHNAELAFSYIPRAVIENGSLTKITKPDLSPVNAPSLVNGPFSVRDAQVNGQWGTYVVGTLGVGGGTVYALDISDGQASPGMFKWEVNLGNANIMADPRIVWLRKPCFPKGSNCAADGKWVVLLPSGYNAQDVALIMLDLADGHELARIKTGAKYTLKSTNKDGTLVCAFEANTNPQNPALNKTLADLGDAVLPKGVTCDNGLGPLTVFDADSDGGADYVFTGDLLGNVWKFDLTGFYDAGGSQASDLNSALKVAYDSPLFIAQTPVEPGTQSTRQSITTMIELDDGAYGEGSMLYFGTGRLFNQAERKFSQRQSFYSVWDIPRYTEQSNIGNKFKLPLRRNPNLAPGAGYDFLHYEVYVINKSNINNDKNTFLKNRSEILGVKRIDQLNSSKYLAYNLAGQNAVSSNDKVVGWIIDFPKNSGLERVLERGRVFEDILFFSSFTPKTDGDDNSEESCTPQRGSVGGAGRFYMVDRMTGAQLTKSPFDFTGDGKQDDADAVKVDPSTLGVSSAEEAAKLGYSVNTDGTVNAGVAGVKIGRGNGDFLSVTGVLERAKQAQNSAKKLDCDYNRQIIFPSTSDPETGNPLVLSSCNKNRYRVWKQPVIE